MVSFRAHESTKSSSRVCSGHGHARHARARIDYSGFAEADPEFSGRQNGECRVVAGLLRRRFCAHAVCFCSCAWRLSDRFGRRPIILASNLGLGVDYFVMALAPSIGWLFLGRIIAGITAASISTAMAYIADVVTPEKRAGAFGKIGAAFGIGFVLGPALGGLLGNFDPRLPFWVAGCLSLTNGIYCYFFVPESLSSDRRKPFELGRANPIGSLVLLRSHPELFRLATIQFTGYIAHEVFEIWALYTIFRYAWSSGMVGLSLAIVGALSVAISGGLVPVVVRRLGERRTLYIGQFFGAVGMLMAGLARTGPVFMASIPIMMLWTISGPAAQGMMPPRERAGTGALQGAIASLDRWPSCSGRGCFRLRSRFLSSPNTD